MMVKTKMFKNGRCGKGARHMKGRKGCWRESRTSMMGSKKRK